jgi:uncharacterized SAM-binding protein YcdF (DUF218 family)
MSLLLPVLFLLPCFWLLAAFCLDLYGRRPHPVGRWDAVVVPGCAVLRNGEPSSPLRRRTLDAVAIWKASGARFLVLTGGVGVHPPSEAEAAAGLAKVAGVPADALLLEDRSTNTWQNAFYSSKLESQGTSISEWRILVVTDGYHTWRCKCQFSRYFSAVNVAGSLPGSRLRIRGALREVFSILKMLYFMSVHRD